MSKRKQYTSKRMAHRRRRREHDQTNSKPEQAQVSNRLMLAYCDRDMRKRILPYDHYVVEVEGRLGVLFTYHWYMETPTYRNLLIVVFEHVEQYPFAPEELQLAMKALNWRSQPNTLFNTQQKEMH